MKKKAYIFEFHKPAMQVMKNKPTKKTRDWKAYRTSHGRSQDGLSLSIREVETKEEWKNTTELRYHCRTWKPADIFDAVVFRKK